MFVNTNPWNSDKMKEKRLKTHGNILESSNCFFSKQTYTYTCTPVCQIAGIGQGIQSGSLPEDSQWWICGEEFQTLYVDTSPIRSGVEATFLNCWMPIVTSSQKYIQDRKGGKNFTVKKPDKHYLSQMIKVYINCGKCVPLICWDENSTFPRFSPPNP